MSTLSSKFFWFGLSTLCMCRPFTNVHMSITSTLLSIENLRVMCGRVAYLLTHRTVHQWRERRRERERERERAGEVSHRRVPGCGSQLAGSSFSGVD